MPTSESHRPRFSSSFGVLMSFIGVAVGLGNVWRFPYMAGAFGGGAFLLVYVGIVAAFGIPALMAELTLGRQTRRGPVGAFRLVGMPGGRATGWVLFVSVLMALSYYTVVVGWVLRYAWTSFTGKLGGIEPTEFFAAMLGGFWGQCAATAGVLALAVLVLMLGVQRGIQRVSSFGMPVLFLLLGVLIVRALTLPGAGEGLRFYLGADFSKVDAGMLAAALGQVFFSMSLGGTFMVTYASYLPDEVDLRNSAIGIGIGETFAAFLAGLVILPAAVAFGIEVNSGPPLTFVTAPSIFARLTGGAFFATIFFGLLFFAAFLSDVAGFEVLIAGLVDEHGWNRNAAVLFLCGAALLLGVVPMLSLDYILKSDLLWGSTMQPVGSAMTLVALAWVVGLRRSLEEVNRGRAGKPIGRVWFYWIKYVVPLAILGILIMGIREVFRVFA